jgi:hypothetical protein
MSSNSNQEVNPVHKVSTLTFKPIIFDHIIKPKDPSTEHQARNSHLSLKPTKLVVAQASFI